MWQNGSRWRLSTVCEARARVAFCIDARAAPHVTARRYCSWGPMIRRAVTLSGHNGGRSNVFTGRSSRRLQPWKKRFPSSTACIATSSCARLARASARPATPRTWSTRHSRSWQRSAQIGSTSRWRGCMPWARAAHAMRSRAAAAVRRRATVPWRSGRARGVAGSMAALRPVFRRAGIVRGAGARRGPGGAKRRRRVFGQVFADERL